MHRSYIERRTLELSDGKGGWHVSLYITTLMLFSLRARQIGRLRLKSESLVWISTLWIPRSAARTQPWLPIGAIGLAASSFLHALGWLFMAGCYGCWLSLSYKKLGRSIDFFHADRVLVVMTPPTDEGEAHETVTQMSTRCWSLNARLCCAQWKVEKTIQTTGAKSCELKLRVAKWAFKFLASEVILSLI